MSKTMSITVAAHAESLLRMRVAVETREGVTRRGVLTGIRYHSIAVTPPQVQDADVATVPSGLVLDGEEGDPIPLGNVVRLYHVAG